MNCENESKRALRRRRGSTTAFFSLGMIPMVGIMALGFEIGNVAVQHKRLQNYVDSKAVAALKEEFGSLPDPIDLADFTTGDARLGPAAVAAVPQKGNWNFGGFGGADRFVETNSLSLTAGEVPAYRVAVEGFDAPLLFGPLFDVPSVQLRAEAVAFAPRREIVIVQDVSGSMCLPNGSVPCALGSPTRLSQAIAANVALVTQILDQRIPGDLVGAVSFNGGVVGTLPLRPIGPGTNNFFYGLLGDGGTDVGAGIRAGNDLFSSTTPNVEIARIMIVVGDGPGGSGAPEAADAAEALGADVYTIAFCDGGNCGAAASFLDGLTRGFGFFREAPDGPTLTQLLNDIVTGVPMKLVR